MRFRSLDEPQVGAHRGLMNRAVGRSLVETGPLQHVAAVVLLAIGLFLGWVAVSLGSDGIRHGPASGGLMEAMLLLGLVIGLVAALHIGAAAQIWARRGRRLGLLIGAIGTLAGVVAVWLAWGTITQAGRLDPLLFVGVPYLVVLLILLRAERQSVAAVRPAHPS